MNSQTQSPRPFPTLPNEIFCQIIDNVVPTSQINAIALAPSNLTTKTLLALARTSRVTFEPALRLLYKHCLHIRSFEQLAILTATLQPPKEIDRNLPSSQPQKQRITPLSVIKSVTSLYLAPFQNNDSTIDEIKLLCTLLDILAPHLTRLVLSIPYTNDRKFKILSPTLRNLTSLELFWSTDNSLSMYNDESEDNLSEKLAWIHWPKLRVLSLVVPRPPTNIWKVWGSMDSLERVILTDIGGNGAVWVEAYQRGQVEMGRNAETAKRLEVVVVESGLKYVWMHEQVDEEALSLRLVCPLDASNNRLGLREEIEEWVTEWLLEGHETVGVYM